MEKLKMSSILSLSYETEREGSHSFARNTTPQIESICDSYSIILRHLKFFHQAHVLIPIHSSMLKPKPRIHRQIPWLENDNKCSRDKLKKSLEPLQKYLWNSQLSRRRPWRRWTLRGICGQSPRKWLHIPVSSSTLTRNAPRIAERHGAWSLSQTRYQTIFFIWLLQWQLSKWKV